MGKVQQYKSGISAFISSENGQRFFNFAYSIGAAIVIWGALFKILHLPGGNTLLSIGMGTEVLMFVLTAFDRPPKEYKWEDVFPALKGEGEAISGGMGGGMGGGYAMPHV
ncbi:MAG: gliding motility protein GldL, partial [Muribaculaceae bacterium]|nr:gliding motility protein GldL [Muribaculaceae bacterium]